MRNKIKDILEENYYPDRFDLQTATDELLNLFGVMRWHSFTRETPDNKRYIAVKFKDGRIKSFMWKYDFYTGDADRNKGAKWKYI